jgi:hypothetical protein
VHQEIRGRLRKLAQRAADEFSSRQPEGSGIRRVALPQNARLIEESYPVPQALVKLDVGARVRGAQVAHLVVHSWTPRPRNQDGCEAQSPLSAMLSRNETFGGLSKP